MRLGADPELAAGERWMSYMLAGRFEEAWRESDRVMAERVRRGERCDGRPHHLRWVWGGAPFDGEHVLVRCYHGLGDSIQFLRYARLLRPRTRAVTVQAPMALLPLLRPLAGVDGLVAIEDGSDPPGWTVDVEATELPHAFRTTIETVPARVPYLAVERGRAELRENRLKVGLVWASGLWRPERNIPLALLAGLAAIPTIDLYCLQRGPSLVETRRSPRLPFQNAGDESEDIQATAALITALDLVISTDTMVAHLAGALGKPVWTMLHFHADWRWLVAGETSPWYPTMRLFRQPSAGDWSTVAREVIAAAETLAETVAR